MILVTAPSLLGQELPLRGDRVRLAGLSLAVPGRGTVGAVTENCLESNLSSHVSGGTVALVDVTEGSGGGSVVEQKTPGSQSLWRPMAG